MTTALDIVRRGLQQWGKIEQVQWTRTVPQPERLDRPIQSEDEKEDKKGFFGTIRSVVSDLYNAWRSAISKPSFANTINPRFSFSKPDTGFGEISRVEANFITKNAQNEQEALSLFKEKGVVEDDSKALNTLRNFYSRENKWAERWMWQDDEKQNSVEENTYETMMSKRAQERLDALQKRSYEVSSRNIGDFAAVRTAQQQKDAVAYLIESALDNVININRQEEYIKRTWGNTEAIASIKNKAERAYELGTRRIVELAELQAKFWGTAVESQRKVREEIQRRGYKNINDFITRDFKQEFGEWGNASLQDYLLTLNTQATWEYKKRQFGEWDTWLFWLLYGSINKTYGEITTSILNPLAASMIWRTWAIGEFAQADVSTLWAVSFTRDAESQTVQKYMNSLLGAVPETSVFLATNFAEGAAAGAAIWALGWLPWMAVGWLVGWLWKLAVWIARRLPQASKIAKKLTWIWETTLTWGTYSYKMMKWIGLDNEKAIKWARMLDNLTYTVTKRVPEEVMVGIVGNAFDTDKWSDLHDHFGMLDVALWLGWGALRQFTRIKRLNQVFNAPEAAKNFQDALILQRWVWGAWLEGVITRAELEFFNSSYKQIIDATEKLIAMKRTGKVPLELQDNALLRLSEAERNKETKKALARSYVRDLYIKNADQLTEADNALIRGIQGLVWNDKLNVADVFKIVYDRPWDVNIAWFESKVRVWADKALEAQEFSYGKSLDSLFDMDWWRPDSVMSADDVEMLKWNVSRLNMYNRLFVEWKPNSKFFESVNWVDMSDWITLNSEWYRYLWILDKRSDVTKLIANDNALSVTDAIRKSAEATWDVVPEQFLKTLEKTNAIDKLISLIC